MRLGDSLFLFVGITVLWGAVGLPWWGLAALGALCALVNYLTRRLRATV